MKVLKVNKYSLEGDYIETFSSRAKAVESLGFSPRTVRTITEAIESGTEYMGYYWDYACEEDR